MKAISPALPLLIVLASVSIEARDFDHAYAAYAEVLARHVRPSGVDYAALKTDRAALDRVVEAFDAPDASAEPRWSREQRMAFWINAYNALTLRLIIDHYPIQSGWLTLQPRNSIRQIDGAWTDRRWRAAGRTVSLDDIEHQILRPTFRDARIHFAVNCASVSCPPLAREPYRPDSLADQLDAAARRFLASREGLQMDGDTLHVTSLFKWYGDDFTAAYAPRVPGPRSEKERAILGVIVAYGPADAAARARLGTARIRFLDYDWSLNDTASRPQGASWMASPWLIASRLAQISDTPIATRATSFPATGGSVTADRIRHIAERLE